MPHTTDQQLEPYLERLRAVPFVRRVELRPEVHGVSNQSVDGELTIATPKRRYRLAIEVRRSFLDRILTHAIHM